MPAKNIGGGRLVRVCDLCGGVDDHPRHVVAGDPGIGPPDPELVQRILNADNVASEDKPALLADLYDTALLLRHLDCCREAGCPDGTCDAQTAGAGSKTGKAMLDHLMARSEGGTP